MPSGGNSSGMQQGGALASPQAAVATVPRAGAGPAVGGGSIEEMAALFKTMQQHMAPTVTEAVSGEQLLALQSRLESLHAANLIADEELYSIEDAVADFSDLRQSLLPQKITLEHVNSAPGNTFEAAAKLLMIVGASETFATSDAAFARQLRRKLRGSRGS
jgi:hypothetical protein